MSAAALEVHLNPTERGVVERLVAEVLELEVGAGQPVNVTENIKIEGRSDPLAVIVGQVQNSGILAGVHADQQPAAGPRPGVETAQELHRLWGFEVADGGAREENREGRAGRLLRERGQAGEVGAEGVNLQVWIEIGRASCRKAE